MNEDARFQLLSAEDYQRRLAKFVREQRLQRNWTQEFLAQRSGVSFGTLKRFERIGEVSLHSYIQLLMALDLEAMLDIASKSPSYRSIDDMIRLTHETRRKRARPK